jgi:type IV secretory pathway VirB4 component
MNPFAALSPSGRARTADAPPGPLTPDERRLALGARSVADLVAPGAAEVARDHLRLDQQYARTLVVTGYPRTVSAGWLRPLVDFEEPLEVSLHLHPLDTGQMVSALSHQMLRLHSSRLLAARGGRLADPEREVAYEDAERLRDALQRGEEKVFSASLYVLLRAASPAALDDLTRRVEATLGGLLAHSRVAYFEQDAGFRSCLPEGRDHLGAYRNLDTSSVATLFPFSSSGVAMERGVLYGIARHNRSPVLVDPFDPGLDNANLVVFARAGAGKSYFTKLLALRALLAGVEFLVVDPEDEYRRLCAAVDGQYVRLASSSAQRLNPFDLPPAAPEGQDEEGEEGRDPLAEQVAALLGLLEVMLADPGRSLSVPERALLDEALYQTYAGAGITADPATHGRAAPLLRDLYRVLQGRPGQLAADLAARLRRYAEGSLAGLFGAPTNVGLDRRFVVFNVQALEPELRPVGIHLITAFVWNRVRRARRPRLLVVDEAWSLLQYPEGGAFLAGLARRARKYYLGLVAISQDVTEFLRSPHGQIVLRTAATKLLLKQDSTAIDDVEAAFRLSAEERRLLLAADKGEGLLFVRGARIALRIEAGPAEHRLATTAPRELAELAELERAGLAAPGVVAATLPPVSLHGPKHHARRRLGPLPEEGEAR